MKPKRILWTELAPHLAMGIGLGFFVVTFIVVSDIRHVPEMIANSAEPQLTMLTLVAVLVLFFAVGATLTGLLFILAER